MGFKSVRSAAERGRFRLEHPELQAPKINFIVDEEAEIAEHMSLQWDMLGHGLLSERVANADATLLRIRTSLTEISAQELRDAHLTPKVLVEGRDGWLLTPIIIRWRYLYGGIPFVVPVYNGPPIDPGPPTQPGPPPESSLAIGYSTDSLRLFGCQMGIKTQLNLEAPADAFVHTGVSGSDVTNTPRIGAGLVMRHIYGDPITSGNGRLVITMDYHEVFGLAVF